MMRKDGLRGNGTFPRMNPLKKKLTNAPMAICEQRGKGTLQATAAKQ